jgi:DnaJ-class molecular chaperone
MKLEEGEVLCSKCSGKGVFYHSDHNGHQHAPVQALVSNCTKCNGAGKLDWISNIMKNINNNHNHTHGIGSHTHSFPISQSVFHGVYDEPSDITFHCEGEEMISIKKDGFYVKGNKIADDLEIYKQFKAFLNQSGVHTI